MKICYLADALNPHTQRWASVFAAMGHEVLVVSDFAPLTRPRPGFSCGLGLPFVPALFTD